MNDAEHSEKAFPGNANLPIGVIKIANREIGVPGGGGWHSRGYLPHFDGAETVQHVTFHLADSLPKEVVDRLDEEIESLPVEKQDVARRKRVDTWIDAGHGSCVLQNPGIAEMVQTTLLYFDAQRYRLLAWVVMPNHVHVLFQPLNGWSVAKIVASWKKFTARKISDSFKSETGVSVEVSQVWHREYWDRYIRDKSHFYQAMEYIHQNPVKAGLVDMPEGWPWSSVRGIIDEVNSRVDDHYA